MPWLQMRVCLGLVQYKRVTNSNKPDPIQYEGTKVFMASKKLLPMEEKQLQLTKNNYNSNPVSKYQQLGSL